MPKFAERELVVRKMNQQFQDNLRMRKETNVLNTRALSLTKNLQVLQKDIRCFGSYVEDLKYQARSNYKNIQAILERQDMKMLTGE
ncbi:Oidioi.mRNA.OKI2018_I69.chr2.g4604.t1.cds [Oikopleura dioica]|uniref:Oidioi.mRNA.OKI2018_I69.chr2.g4604.t1.cds n=1 Tax=Oikopleura dioica TaxID=34765 RepID=A0ABN7T4D3_OIKDI|nr:Oidioi.mRNA.OKI2018_I69.chr2.g4604.t1.cds [Oikopleura dioica]